MARYVDCMIAPIQETRMDAYRERAKLEAEAFKRLGAITVLEAQGDDVPEGETTSLPLAVKLEPGEVIVASWVIWPDKAARDKGMEAAMQEPLFTTGEMLFDGKRLIFGGFEMLVEV